MRSVRWTPEDDLKLIVLNARGAPTDRIARLLGRGSRTAVRDRLQHFRRRLRDESLEGIDATAGAKSAGEMTPRLPPLKRQ
jgi:hypothetical protein